MLLPLKNTCGCGGLEMSSELANPGADKTVQTHKSEAKQLLIFSMISVSFGSPSMELPATAHHLAQD